MTITREGSMLVMIIDSGGSISDSDLPPCWLPQWYRNCETTDIPTVGPESLRVEGNGTDGLGEYSQYPCEYSQYPCEYSQYGTDGLGVSRSTDRASSRARKVRGPGRVLTVPMRVLTVPRRVLTVPMRVLTVPR